MEEEETLLDVQHSPLFKLKRRVLILALLFNYFLSGLEYSITIPPAFLNGKYSSIDRTFMILEVGLYPLFAMVSSLILGHVYDRTKRIRTQLIVSNFLQIIGNFIYAINYSRWLPLLGRMISGCGDGFIAISIAEITYVYEEHNRVGKLCILELGRVLGFMMGPIVNFFILEWTTRNHWTLNNKSLPSYIMGCCWVAILVITVCCVHNLALEVIEKFNLNDSPFLKQKTLIYNEKKGKYERADEKEGDDEDRNDDDDDDDDDENDDEEEGLIDLDNPFLEPDYDEDIAGEIVETEGYEKEEEKDLEQIADDIFPIPEKKEELTKRDKLKLFATKMDTVKRRISDNASHVFNNSHLSEILHLEFGLLMVVNFVIWYCQTTFLMLCSYITTFEYHWTSVEIGFMYVCGFVLVIAMFMIMYFLREAVLKKNIYLVIVSMAFVQISLGLLVYESVPKQINKRTVVFVFSALLLFASMPLSLVCYKTLLTGIVRPGIQGTLQGASSSISKLAILSGLLLSIETCEHRQVYGSVMTAICFVTIILFFLTFDNITRKQKESTMRLSF